MSEPRKQWTLRVKKGLDLDFPYARKMPDFIKKVMPDEGGAAVLFLFGFLRGDLEFKSPHFLITKRSETVETHKGQMAFPGGMLEENESVIDAALRETHEEVGILSDQVEVIGTLPLITTMASQVWVRPVIGLLKGSLEDVEPKVMTTENDAVFWVQWSDLSRPGVYRMEKFSWNDRSITSPVFALGALGQAKVWGLTGMLIKNFLDRFESVC